MLRVSTITSSCVVSGMSLRAASWLLAVASLHSENCKGGVRLSTNNKTNAETCQTRFSKNASDAVARAKCFNNADALSLPISPIRDLINLRIAKRTELAERQAAGKITRAQVVLELGQLNSQIESEWQSRSNSNRSVRAQEVSAAAAVMSTPNPFAVPAVNPCPILVGGRCR